MKKIISIYLRPYYGRMGIGFAIKFIGSVMDLCIPWVLAFVIDNVIPAGSLKQIYLWGGVMIFCSFASFMAEAMIWWMFRTVLGLSPLAWCLLSTRSILPLVSSFL